MVGVSSLRTCCEASCEEGSKKLHAHGIAQGHDEVGLCIPVGMWYRSGQKVGQCVVYSWQGCGLEFG